MIKYFSLFSGIGGFELGINKVILSKQRQEKLDSLQFKGDCPDTNDGFSIGTSQKSQSINTQNMGCVGFSEIDKYAIQIYKNHFNHKGYGNVRETDWDNVEDFELLVGGFPCQAFSIAGKRKGFGDTRGTLFFEIARAAQEKQPRLLLLENVKGLLSHDKGKTFGVILNTLDELGYDLQWQVLNSKNFGVPQNRERIFIIGHLRGTSRPQIFPYGTPTKVYNREGQASINGERYSRDTSNTLRLPLSKRVNKDIDRVRIRRLTPIECERLQGFPDNWTEGISDTQRYKCLGNAVTVNVVEAIIRKLYEAIKYLEDNSCA